MPQLQLLRCRCENIYRLVSGARSWRFRVLRTYVVDPAGSTCTVNECWASAVHYSVISSTTACPWPDRLRMIIRTIVQLITKARICVLVKRFFFFFTKNTICHNNSIICGIGSTKHYEKRSHPLVALSLWTLQSYYDDSMWSLHNFLLSLWRDM